MVSKSKFSFVGLGFLLCSFAAIMLLLCLVITQDSSASVTTGDGCCYGEMEKQNRKLLSEKQVAKAPGVHATTASSIEEETQNKMGDSELLRMVPSGPDPLHHNGNPKKPRTP